MRLGFLVVCAAVSLTPASARAQGNQWQQFGAALGQAIRNSQQQQQQQQQVPQNGSRGGRNYQYLAPNSSGQANMGNLNNSGDFFGGQNNGGYRPSYQPSNVYTPNTSSAYRPQSQYQPQYNQPYNQNQYQPQYNQPQYSQPQQQYSSSGNNYQPQARGNYGDPPQAPKPQYSNLPILITCPDGLTGQCHYELVNAAGKAYPYDISAGEKQTFDETTQWQIRYDQGQGRGFKSYSLRGGKQYSLQRDDQGLWQLFME